MSAIDAAPRGGPLASVAFQTDRSSAYGVTETEKPLGAYACIAMALAGFNALTAGGAEIISANCAEAGDIGKCFRTQEIFLAGHFPALYA
jgi:hypothetical protein